MRSQFPLWFVIPTHQASETHHDGSAVPVVFSSAAKLTAWLASRQSENYWYVRLLDRDATAEALNELQTRGCTEIDAQLDGHMGKMTIADLVQVLAKG